MLSSILMLISVCTMDVTQDTVLSLSGHYITGCPLLPLSSPRRHVSRVWERDQYCIREEENIERWNKSIDFPHFAWLSCEVNAESWRCRKVVNTLTKERPRAFTTLRFLLMVIITKDHIQNNRCSEDLFTKCVRIIIVIIYHTPSWKDD